MHKDILIISLMALAPIATQAHADDYIRFDISADRANGGYPRTVTDQNWPGLASLGQTSAAVEWDNGKAYFFCGSQYTRYDIASDKADPGYPKTIDTGTWLGLWANGVDAALNWGNGKAYFFDR